MEQLTQEQRDELESHLAALRSAAAKVAEKVEELNDELAIIGRDLESAIDGYNRLVREADVFRHSVAADIEDYIDGQPDAWQLSPAGQAAICWLECWQSSLPTSDGELPAAIELPEAAAIGELESLPATV